MFKYVLNVTGIIIVVLCLMVGFQTELFAQQVENIDGIRIVHNSSKGLWGNSPEVEIRFEKNIGSIDAEDENLLFYLPVDVTVDSEGNIYVLDQGNNRVQKFDHSGNYLATFGREGQGPGEFKGPTSLAVDQNGNVYVGDEQNKRIQVFFPDGRNKQTIPIEGSVGKINLMKNRNILMTAEMGFGSISMKKSGEESGASPLFVVLTPEGIEKEYFGIPYKYDGSMANIFGNRVFFAVGENDNVYVSFQHRNRIEKYSSRKKPDLRIDRKLNYEEILPPSKDSKVISYNRSLNQRKTSQIPTFVKNSSGIGVDSKGRIWIATIVRPIKEEEKAGRNTAVSFKDGKAQITTTVQGATDVLTTDVFKLEVFAPTGELLGAIPLTHFCDCLRIFGDKLYIIDEVRGMQVYEYTIVEK